MRRRSSLGSIAFSGALFALLLGGCGHAISISDGATVSNGGASTGGRSFDVLVQELPIGGDTATGGTAAVNTGPCPAASMPNEAVAPGYTAPKDPGVASLLSSMSNDDKFTQMYGVPDPNNRDVGYGNIEQSQEVKDLPNGKILRGYKYRDAGRGVNLDARQPNNRATQGHDYSTAFPAESTRAASWDVDNEIAVGEAMGDEVMGSLNNMLLAPCMNILRHPYWGRSQETYGEDMYQVGRMASALTVGVQKHVVACAKHYAANNVENGRATQNAVMNEQTLREVYVQHFAMVVQQAGVGSVMAAYNSLNSIKCTQNKHLLGDILKGPTSSNGLGFRGFVISDWWAMPGYDKAATDTSLAQQQTIEAVNAGLDIEVPWSIHFAQLSAVVGKPGGLTINQVNDSVSRILEQKFRFGTVYTTDPWGPPPALTALSTASGFTDSLTKIQKHLDLAEETEIRSAVLLSNGTGGTPVLPIPSTTANIAVIGLDIPIEVSTQTNLQPGTDGIQHFATGINTGDRGSSRINSDPALSIGPYDGIKVAAPQGTTVTSANTLAAAQAANADLNIVVVGLTAGDEGEEYSVKSFGDRQSLDLPAGQTDLVNGVLAFGKPTVIIIESGSIVNVPWLSNANKQQATIWAGYSGQYGGAAYGQLLFGQRNFSGKLAVSWPQESDMKALIPFRDADPNSVNMAYFFGYRMYDQHPEVTLVFPFGFGLSYTTFAYSNLQIPCGVALKSDVVNVTADIANTGSVAGDETMMLFVAPPPKPATITGDRPVKELKRFQRVNGIQPAGQAKSRFRVTLPIRIQDLQHWEGDATGKWVIDSGDYTIYVGPNADPKNLTLQGKLTVQGG